MKLLRQEGQGEVRDSKDEKDRGRRENQYARHVNTW